MEVVFSELSNEHTNVVFKRVCYGLSMDCSTILLCQRPVVMSFQVEAEQIDDVTLKFGVTSVPTFIFLKVTAAPCLIWTSWLTHAYATQNLMLIII